MHAAVVVILEKRVKKKAIFNPRCGLCGQDAVLERSNEASADSGGLEVGYEEVSLCLSDVWTSTSDKQTIQINSQVNVDWVGKSLLLGS